MIARRTRKPRDPQKEGEASSHMCGCLCLVKAAYVRSKYYELVASNEEVSIIINASNPKSRQESKQARTHQCFGHDDPALTKRTRRKCHTGYQFSSLLLVYLLVCSPCGIKALTCASKSRLHPAGNRAELASLTLVFFRPFSSLIGNLKKGISFAGNRSIL